MSSGWKYLAVYIIPLMVIISLSLKGVFTFLAMAFAFVLVPFLELFFKPSEKNMDIIQEELVRKDRLYDFFLYSLVPLQYGIMAYFLIRISSEDLDLFSKIGMMSAFGLSCGVVAINGAHELGHRLTKLEQGMSKALLFTSMFMHFFIEHNRGHHRRVATYEDPASARFGESIYFFLPRTIVFSYLSAWNLSNDQAKRSGHTRYGLGNEMVLFTCLQLLLVLLIVWMFSVETLLWFIGSAFIGILLLETVDYIEHYGLSRNKNEKGKYERVRPIHSWNSNHPIGRLMLLELSRHSDHHSDSTREYPVLRHHEESPQLPTGYPGMMLLSFLPPIWFNVMHPRIRKLEKAM